MNAVIIFDVSDRRVEIIESMKNLGYSITWINPGTNILYNLPSNVVWKPNAELNTALNELKNVISILHRADSPIELLRCIILNSTPWDGIGGTQL